MSKNDVVEKMGFYDLIENGFCLSFGLYYIKLVQPLPHVTLHACVLVRNFLDQNWQLPNYLGSKYATCNVG